MHGDKRRLNIVPAGDLHQRIRSGAGGDGTKAVGAAAIVIGLTDSKPDSFN